MRNRFMSFASLTVSMIALAVAVMVSTNTSSASAKKAHLDPPDSFTIGKTAGYFKVPFDQALYDPEISTLISDVDGFREGWGYGIMEESDNGLNNVLALCGFELRSPLYNAMNGKSDPFPATLTNSHGFVPKYTILPWAGDIANLPPGYVLCDGTNGTPDLRGQSLVGKTSITTLGDFIGSDTHTHSFTPAGMVGTPSATITNLSLLGIGTNAAAASTHAHTFTGTAGTTGTGSNLPPSYVVNWIMKV